MSKLLLRKMHLKAGVYHDLSVEHWHRMQMALDPHPRGAAAFPAERPGTLMVMVFGYQPVTDDTPADAPTLGITIRHDGTMQ